MPQLQKIHDFLNLAAKGDINRLKSVISSRNVDVCWKTEEGSTALHKAAWNGQLDVIKLLVTTKIV